MTSSLQAKVAQSRWTLTITAIYAVAVCLAAGLIHHHLWLQTLLLAVSTLLMVELNNANSLIRIYSRSVSCSFLVMTTMSSFLLPSIDMAVTQMALITFYLYIFRAYQDPAAAGRVFYAFAAIGVGSIVFVQILFLVPLLWVLLATNILAFNSRTFFASLLGIMAPYWFAGAYHLWMGNALYIPEHFMMLAQLGQPFQLGTIDEHRLVTATFVLLLAAIGSIHFLMYSYLDKIRTRMIYEMLITINVCCFAWMLLQPQHFDFLLSMAIVTTAPLIGHYLALSHTKVSNICFIVLTATALILTLYNLWMQSPLFS